MIEDEMITLWTIQSLQFYNNLKETGVLRTNKDLSYFGDNSNYFDAYNWISNQMRKRVGKPKSNDITFPIWAWYQWEGERKRMDLRCSGFAKRGTQMVQIEFVAPRKDILLSDFDAWHCVINKCYFPNNDRDEEEFEKKYQGTNISTPQMLKELEKSWEKIFDLNKCIEREFSIKDFQSIQATVWEIKLEQIRKVEQFTAK